MADYAANISVKVGGLNQVEKLETAVKDLTTNLSKLNKIAVNPFKAQISSLKEVNRLLKSNAQLLKNMSGAAVKQAAAPRAKKETVAKEIDSRLFKEQAEFLARSVALIQKRNAGLSQSADIASKELEIRKELEKGAGANLAVVRAMLSNMRQVVAEQQKQEAEAAKVSAQLDIQVSLAQSLRTMLGDAATGFAKGIGDSLKLLRSAGKLAGGIGNSIGNATIGEKATKEVARQAKNVGTRGLIGAAAVGGVNAAANAYAGLADSLTNVQGALADAAGTPIVGGAFDALSQSVPMLDSGMADLAQTVAQLTGNWGMAAVAAMALAPQLKDLAKGTYEIGQAAGSATKQKLLGNLDEELPSMTAGMKALNAEMERYRRTELGSQGFRDFQAQTIPAAREQGQVDRAYRRSSAAKTEARERAAAAKAEAQAAKSAAEATRQQALALQELSRKYGALIPQVAEYQRLTESIEAVTRAASNLERTRASYFETTSRSMQTAIQKTREYTQVINDLNGATRAPARQAALRPAGMSDEDVLRLNQNQGTFGANRPFAPASNPAMSPASLKAVNTEAAKLLQKQQAIENISDQTRQNWKDVLKYAKGDLFFRGEIKQTTAETYALKQRELRTEEKINKVLADREAKKKEFRLPRNRQEIEEKINSEGFGENLALGVGFPLLFGGGPGSVIGSGIGSFLGEGFGGQILGGAVGQIIDQTVASAQALGNALAGLNMDQLEEQGLVINGQLQEQIRLLKRAGDYDTAEAVLTQEAKNTTGDLAGGQAKLAAGSVNELKKAWDGVVKALTTAVGVLAAPFIQALTAVLRLVQGIVVAWNSIVGVADALTQGFFNLVGGLFGVEDAADAMYQQTLKNTAEYEKGVAELKQQTAELSKQADLAERKARIDKRITDLDLSKTSGFTIDDKVQNATIDRQKELTQIGSEAYDLIEGKEKELADLREKYGKVYNDEREKAEKEINRKFAAEYQTLVRKKLVVEKDYYRQLEQLANQRAQQELQRAEAAQALRRRAVALDRGGEDLRLNAEQTILQLRRQGAAIEKSAAELRMSIEDRIYDKRVAVQQMQLDISRRREQLAINEVDLAAQAAKQFTGAVGEDLGNQLLDSTRQVVKVKAEGEADIQRKELELAIKIDQIDRDTKKFELEVAKKIEQIKQAVADYELAAAQAELRLSRSAADLKIAAADYAVAKRKEEIALMEEAAARIATSQLAQQIGGAYTNTAKAGSSSQVKALTEAANELGISAKDLASIVSYETGGKFDPNIMGGRGGNYQGLIQFGPEERKAYGVKPGMSFEEQITGPVVDYLKDRFAKVGRSTQGATLSDLYRTVNGGNPNAPLGASDGNGTIAEHIKNISENHGKNAEKFLGGNVEITRAVTEGVVAGNEQSQPASAAVRPETTAAQSKVDAAVKAAEEARSQIKPSVAVDTNVDALLEKNRQLADQQKEVLRLEADTSAEEAKQRYRQQELADLQKTQQLILATKQPILEIIQQQQVAAEMRERESQLLSEGMLPAQVQQTLEIEKQVNLQMQKLDGSIAILESRVAELSAQENQTEAVRAEVALLEQKLGLLRAAKGEVQAAGQAAAAGAADANSPANRLQGEVNAAKAELSKLQDPINLVVGGADAIGSAFGDAFKNIVSGSMSAQEAFAAMTQKIADYFLDMAAQMLAQYVKLIIMQTVLNAIGGPSLGTNVSPVSSSSPNVLNGLQNFGGQSVSTGIGQAATGGRASGGEPIIVGERGPEIFTPDNAGSIGSNRYFDAARDSMSHDADTAANNVTEQRDSQFYEAMQSPEGREMKVSYDATVINEVEYVTADQFQRGMKDTASRARAETLKDLRNYPGKRAAVGMR